MNKHTTATTSTKFVYLLFFFFDFVENRAKQMIQPYVVCEFDQLNFKQQQQQKKLNKNKQLLL